MSFVKSFSAGKFYVTATFHQWLLASSVFSCMLLLVRMLVTHSIEYIFLPWNLFLAFIPYWITGWVTANIRIIKQKYKLVLVLALWLLFVPNSFYIITDLFHLTHIRSAPKWFDLLLIFSFAWNGILCGIISLQRVESILQSAWRKEFSILLVFAVMWLNALGIYIGRFLRFNSWDIISDPISLASEIFIMIFQPIDNWYAWGMTFCYAIFMSLLYISIKKITETIKQPANVT